MTTLVRVDRVSGYKWVDFYVDQAARWVETVTRSTGTAGFGEGGFGEGGFGGGAAIDASGWTARLVVIRSGLDAAPVLDLVSPSDITINGPAGRFSWDVPATAMAAFTHPVYQHELTLFPDADPALAFPLLKGRVLVRATALPVSAPPGISTGWGHGPWGQFPWGNP